MPGIGITFDFHNTLFTCDEWFELEVREIVPAFLTWAGEQEGLDVPPAAVAEGRRLYAELRSEIKLHGREQDAASCVADVLALLNIPVKPSTIESGVHTIMEQVPVAEPMPGALETVRALARLNIPLGIVSSAIYAPFLERSLRTCGGGDAFAAVTTSASAGFYKTRPEVYWHAASAMGISPEFMLHVGDSLAFDVGGAERAGFHTTWLSYGRTLGEDEPKPDLVLSDLQDAVPHLVGLAHAARDGQPQRPSP